MQSLLIKTAMKTVLPKLYEIKTFIKETVLVILSLCVLFLYPFLSLFLGLVWIYRSIVEKLVKWQDPKISHFLSGMDALIAAHNTYSPVPILVPLYFLNTKVEIPKTIELFNEKIISSMEHNGNCVYPELKQRIVRKYGYNWWRTVDNFKLKNHVRNLDENNPERVFTRRELRSELQKLIKMPFNPKFSPWEMIIVKNFADETNPEAKSALLFRFHHCLCDGFSVVKFTKSLGVKDWKNSPWMSASPKQKTLLENLGYHLNLFLTMPYHILNSLVPQDNNEWVRIALNEYCNTRTLKEVDPIPISQIKTVREKYSVGFSTVVIGIVTEAVSRSMARDNYPTNRFCIAMPFPVEGHPEGRLTNHWSIAKMSVKIYRDNPGKTLRNIEKEFKNLKYSMAPLASFYFSKLVGLLPIPFIPQSDKALTGTCLLSNLPGPTHEIDVLGCKLAGVLIAANAPRGYAVATACGSYNGELHGATAGESCIFRTEEDADFYAKSHTDALDMFRADSEQNFKVEYKGVNSNKDN